ncbi:MAG: thiamine phosphate synthase [Propioniciclava sp.]|uniref:thiamine phosphate synthase n=1 Tax=Propioniciclava sp. TaxID=2038686 RepID=UPI0039E2944F
MTRPAFDLSVYLVTDTGQCGALGVAETVRRAVAGGATLVQLRDPDASRAELVALGRELLAVLDGTGVPLIINDHADVAAEIGADGVHIGQGDLAPDAVRAIIGPDALLGLSTHDAAEVDAAAAWGDVLDYLGVGPVWPTGSKADAADAIGTDTLAALARRSAYPCVAIGGISAARVTDVRRAGADGVAVISAICGQPDVEAATRDLVQRWASAASPDQGERR